MAKGHSTCSVHGCDKPVRARGWCSGHWSRWRKHGSPAAAAKGCRLPATCDAYGCNAKPHARWEGGKAYCNKHLLRVMGSGSEDLQGRVPPPPMPQCSATGCEMESRSRNAGYCEMHYGRMRRSGTLERVFTPTGKAITTGGYVKVRSPDHPLADKSGYVFEHRSVAYAEHGDGPLECYWCAAPLTWPKAVVDHLDENKKGNTPSNLVVSCSPCNRARGAVLPFVARMTPAAWRRFIECAVTYRASHHAR